MTDVIPDYASQMSEQFSAQRAQVADTWVAAIKPVCADARATLIARNNSGQELYTPAMYHEYKQWLIRVVDTIKTRGYAVPEDTRDRHVSDATWCLLKEAMRIYHTGVDSVTIIANDVVGQLVPGLVSTVPINDIDRYRCSGFSAIFRRELIAQSQRYHQLFRGTVSGPSRSVESRQVHFGVVLWVALCNTFSRLMQRLPELPEYANFDLCRRAAVGARLAIMSEPDIDLHTEHRMRTFVSMHLAIEHAMLGDFIVHDITNLPNEVDILCGQIDYAQRLNAHMLGRENSPGYQYDITADRMNLLISLAETDTQWVIPADNEDLRGQFITNDGPRLDLPSSIAHDVAEDMPLGLLGVNPEYREAARWVISTLATVAVWEQARPEEEVNSFDGPVDPVPHFPTREAIIWDPTGPQQGEVWGDPDNPLTWIYLSSVNPDDRFVTVSFDATGILQGVGELTQAEVPMSGRVRIFPPLERDVVLPVGFGKRAVRLRNGLQALAIDE